MNRDDLKKAIAECAQQEAILQQQLQQTVAQINKTAGALAAFQHVLSTMPEEAASEQAPEEQAEQCHDAARIPEAA